MSIIRTNAEVAAVFQAIADLLDQQGENPFKIKAYRSAVRTLHDLTEPVAGIAARGELRQLPGFGEAIAGKTQEILTTGTCDLYERLKAAEAASDLAEDLDAEPAVGGTSGGEDLPAPW